MCLRSPCPMTAARSVSLFVALLLAGPVAAQEFSDVPSDHAFAFHVRALAAREIVRGNPDGTYHPAGVINRAEMLTLLYRAAGRTPDAEARGCFDDVAGGSWYEPVVCDAVAAGFVSGYPDRTFRPQQTVNRMEALKMIHTVLQLPLPDAIPPGVTLRYDDLDDRAWYLPYVAGAFRRGIIPIAGQEGPQLLPGQPLARGEAAAYLANALGLTVVIPVTEGNVSSSASSSISTASAPSGGAATSVATSAFSTIDTSFPFTAQSAHVVRFTIREPVTGELRATVDPGRGKPGLTCRLFRMEAESGFSTEYYLGQVTGNDCVLRAALIASAYQLEVRPAEQGAPFTVDGNIVTGDGNDGFSEAVTLSLRKTRTGILEDGDIADWYTFRLDRPQSLTVEADGSGTECMVYALEDVDLFGFAGPSCNMLYDYPRGTYVIGLRRRDARAGRLTFSLGLR